jgi:hypothetical protein
MMEAQVPHMDFLKITHSFMFLPPGGEKKNKKKEKKRGWSKKKYA